jgi:hypothetical protein
MRTRLLVGVLLLAGCSSDRLVRPDPPSRQSLGPSVPGGVQDAPCKTPGALTFYVQAQRVGGNGTNAAPFGTISDALAAGTAQSACYVRLLLLGGTFPEIFTVPVPRLEIVASGGINIIHGGITSYGSWLSLRGVTVNVVGSTGIRQVGGQLQLVGVSVANAATDSKNLDSGLGIWLSGGALATMDLVLLANNGHQALRIEGTGTEAWLSGVVVSNTGIHPGELARIADGTASEDDYVGAVQVSQRAKAIIKNSAITGSAVLGLDVDHGAQALLVRSSVSQTSSIPTGPFRAAGAYNIESRMGATVEGFYVLTRNATVDLVVYGGGLLTMHHGVVDAADIGLSFAGLPDVPGHWYPLCAGLDGTVYRAVGVPMQSGDYSPYPSPDAVADPARCGHVADDPRPF